MSARDLLAFAVLGAGAYALWRSSGGIGPAGGLKPPLALPGGPGGPIASALGPVGFVSKLIAAESGGNLAAKNPRSTASGKYQFTRATWLAVGGAWGADLSRPFGGLAPSEAEQDARFATLTRRNGAQLAAAGISATGPALYAAHFLGAGLAARVLAAPPSTKLAELVGSKVIAANPHLAGFSVADFGRWLTRKAG